MNQDLHIDDGMRDLDSEIELKLLRSVMECVSGDLHSDEILHKVLESIQEVLGFEYATISIVDRVRQVIETKHGIWRGQLNQYPTWIQLSRYPLDSNDIQADIVRKGRPEVLHGWNERLNKEIWDTFGHERLIRVFVPIRLAQGEVLGTIEAGDEKVKRADIEPAEIRTLLIFASYAAFAVHVAQYIDALQASKDREMAKRYMSAFRTLGALHLHEVKNAVVCIRTSVDMLTDWLGTKPVRITLCLDALRYTADYLHRLGLPLLQALKPFKITTLDVGAVLGETFKHARIPKNVLVENEVAKGRVYALSNEDILEGIFANIIRNACEAMESTGGHLTVSAAEDNILRTVTVRFTDTGPGIKNEIAEKLFDGIVTTKPNGTGLALLLSAAIARSMDADIKLETTSSIGSIFSVVLPSFVPESSTETNCIEQKG